MSQYYKRNKSLGEYTDFVGSGPGMTKPSSMTLPMSGISDAVLIGAGVGSVGLSLFLTGLTFYGGYKLYKAIKK